MYKLNEWKAFLSKKNLSYFVDMNILSIKINYVGGIPIK